MTNPSTQTNPLDYPKYVRGLRPALPQSTGDYVETELEKIQNSMENMAVAADKNTKTQVAELKIEVDANTASITDEQTVRATADDALSTRITDVTAAYQAADGNLQTTLQASITDEANARAAADLALSDRINIVEATAGSKIFYQTTEPAGTAERALQDGDLWFDTDDSNHPYIYTAGAWTDNTDGQITANAAAITSEQQARIDADGTLASDINTVSTTVNENTATIQTIQTSLNGVEAKYGVQLNVAGHITGFVQNNDGQTGSFIVTADKFAIVSPSAGAGDTGDAPFEVISGQTYIKDAFIQNLTVDKINGGTLNTGATPIVQDSDWNIGTGHIVFDNGSVMKVAGVGFGTANQFIEWFGPTLASYDDCSEANATYYLKINGDAYFGGALSAGVLRTSGQTTDTSPTASITIGSFSSNGGTISAFCSYSYNHQFNCSHGSGSVDPDTTTVIKLEGSTNGGSMWATLATLNVTIHGQVINNGTGVPDLVKINGSGSSTVNWTPGALGTLQLRGRISTYAVPSGTGTSITNNTISQNITVSSTEQP